MRGVKQRRTVTICDLIAAVAPQRHVHTSLRIASPCQPPSCIRGLRWTDMIQKAVSTIASPSSENSRWHIPPQALRQVSMALAAVIVLRLFRAELEACVSARSEKSPPAMASWLSLYCLYIDTPAAEVHTVLTPSASAGNESSSRRVAETGCSCFPEVSSL